MWVPYQAEHLAGVLLAQTGGAETPWLSLVNYGVLGLIVLGLTTNRLALPREVKAADAALAEERKAHAETKAELTAERIAHNETRTVVFTALIGDVVPALKESSIALGRKVGGPPG